MIRERFRFEVAKMFYLFQSAPIVDTTRVIVHNKVDKGNRFIFVLVKFKGKNCSDEV